MAREASAPALQHDEPPWPIERHGSVLAGLWRAAREERLPHALLFRGRAGIGRWRAARALAAGLVCVAGGPPCLACGPCKRFLSRSHPDVLAIDGEGEEVLKLELFSAREQGGSAEDFLALRPFEGGWRIVLVREAERANKSAQNALLKSLEEPGRDVLWVLETARPQGLLATLRSRCVEVRFEPLTREETLRVMAEHGITGDLAAELARWSGGAPGRALAYHARGARELRAVLAQVLAGELDGLAAARAAWQVEGEFPGRTPTAQARERARTLLDLALDVLRDVARHAAGTERVAHEDLARACGALAASPGLVAWQVEALCGARRDVQLNLDPAAAVERALLALARRPAIAHAKSEPR